MKRRTRVEQNPGETRHAPHNYSVLAERCLAHSPAGIGASQLTFPGSYTGHGILWHGISP